MTAKEFIETLKLIALDYREAIPKRELFALAKRYQKMPVDEVIKLLKDDNEDYRLCAVSVLDWKARDKKTSLEEKEEAYNAYVNNHKWIDNWGMVDRAAPYVVGGYLYNQERKPLYDLAASKNPMERRTAIVSTYYFIRKNEIEETFKIAEILVNDTNEYVQKAVGSWIREAGKRNENKLKSFLEKHASTMPRITLRYAIEKFDKDTRTYLLSL
ncbi:DNA alkylation repair protein [Lacinutrix chionoecetis]